MNTKHLTEIMKYASKYSAKKSQLPILANALIKIENGNLTITTTDLEKHFTCQVENAENKDLITCLPSKTLADLLKVFNQDEPTYFKNVITKETDCYNRPISKIETTITNDNATFTLKALDPEEFPHAPDETAMKETIALKYDLTATLYTKPPEILNQWEQAQIDGKRINKEFPKYLKLDGMLYTKDGKPTRDYDWKNDKPVYGEWNCQYQDGTGENFTKVFLHDLEMYDKIYK